MISPSRRRLSAIAGAVALTLAGAVAIAADGDLDLVSRTSTGAATDGESSRASVSGDGRLIAFVSDADNLSVADDDRFTNVFLRDTATGETSLISRAAGPTGAGASANSGDPAVSANGRFVVYRSGADDLSAEDDDRVANIFRRDVITGDTTLVSRETGPNGTGADGFSYEPAISADGRLVAFQSFADNLSTDDDDRFANVFVRDLQSGTTTLVSRLSGASGAGADGGSGPPAISADGRFVAFASTADNLSADDDDAIEDVFVRDTQTQTTLLVSRASGRGGAAANAASTGRPAISADGQRVAFSSDADNLSGRDNNAVRNVFLRNIRTDLTSLVSRAGPPGRAAADADSSSPSISADGGRVAFVSGATNLSDADETAVQDVYVRDLDSGVVSLASRASGAQGPGADGDSLEPSLSPNGLRVAFTSRGENLSAADAPGMGDVFARTLAPPAVTVAPPVAKPPKPGRPRVAAPLCAGLSATIVGTLGPDTIVGTPGRDIIASLGGDDVVVGGEAGDLICLGRGSDRARAGNGRDRVFGGPGNDRISGGGGRDVLRGGSGHDVLRGGARADRMRGDSGRDLLIGGPDDRFIGGPQRDRCSVARRAPEPCR